MFRSTLVAALALAAVLIAPATSIGGGWATVGLSSSPDGARPGEAWVVELTMSQHGRTPLDGVKPAVLIEPLDRGSEKSFTASPTGRSGVYRARVVFPSAGEWRYAVDDGFSAVHELGTVRVGGPAVAPLDSAGGGSDDGGGVSLFAALGLAAGAGLLAALVVGPLRRRVGSRPAKA